MSNTSARRQPHSLLPSPSELHRHHASRRSRRRCHSLAVHIDIRDTFRSSDCQAVLDQQACRCIFLEGLVVHSRTFVVLDELERLQASFHIHLDLLAVLVLDEPLVH